MCGIFLSSNSSISQRCKDDNNRGCLEKRPVFRRPGKKIDRYIDKVFETIILNTVHLWRADIKTAVISKELILDAGRSLVEEKGISALNMRDVAGRCGIALGSLYNYFSSKDELLIAVIEHIWYTIFSTAVCSGKECTFTDYITLLFHTIREGTRRYPDFFTAHSIGFAGSAKDDARQKMALCVSRLKQTMVEVMQQDERINPAVFSPSFSHEDFADFVFTNVMSLFLKRQESCTVLIEVIRRTVYGAEMQQTETA
ncbi:MAG: TetR/AcrR family transcriptional regulator [Treponema sp.]